MNLNDIEIIDIEQNKPSKTKKSRKGLVIVSTFLFLFIAVFSIGFVNRARVLNFLFRQNLETIEARSTKSENTLTEKPSQSNERDTNRLQLRIINNYINIRSEANPDSELLGKVEKDEIYDILKTDEDEFYSWYKIRTSSNITGYIASPKQDASLEDIDPPYVEILKY